MSSGGQLVEEAGHLRDDGQIHCTSDAEGTFSKWCNRNRKLVNEGDRKSVV